MDRDQFPVPGTFSPIPGISRILTLSVPKNDIFLLEKHKATAF